MSNLKVRFARYREYSYLKRLKIYIKYGIFYFLLDLDYKLI